MLVSCCFEVVSLFSLLRVRTPVLQSHLSAYTQGVGGTLLAVGFRRDLRSFRKGEGESCTARCGSRKSGRDRLNFFFLYAFHNCWDFPVYRTKQNSSKREVRLLSFKNSWDSSLFRLRAC